MTTSIEQFQREGSRITGDFIEACRPAMMVLLQNVNQLTEDMEAADLPLPFQSAIIGIMIQDIAKFQKEMLRHG